MKSLCSFAACILLVAYVSASAARSDGAQATAAPENAKQESVPVFRINASLVAIDVVAEDKAGNPVLDLKPEDINVFEDKQPRPIKRMVLERPGGDDTVRYEAFQKQLKQIVDQLPAGASSNLSALSTAAAPASSIILFDDLNTPFEAKAYARKEMLKMLQQVPPGQPVAVYGLSASLHLLQDFTRDLSALQSAVSQAAHAQTPISRLREGDIDHSASDAIVAGPGSKDMVSELQAFEFEESAQKLDVRVRITADALVSLARRMESVPGRKNLIWVSGGFPIELMPDVDSVSALDMHRYDNVIAEVAAALENARVSVYPVDANGLDTAPVYDASNKGSFTNRSFGSQLNSWSAQNVSAHQAMSDIAQRTGGRAFFNRNDLGRAAITAMQDGGTYYAVLFAPASEQADGRFHALKLTTSRKDVKLHYRQGYFALDPKQPDKDRQKHMADEIGQVLGSPQLATGIILTAMPHPNTDSINMVIGASTLTYAQADDGLYHTDFELATALFDAKGKLLSGKSDVIRTSYRPDGVRKILREGMPIVVNLPAGVNATRVRLVVRDIPSDRIGSVDVAFVPQNAAK